MYSQNEIKSAIEAGVLPKDTADALETHVSALRKRPLQDEEHFRLISSFNDIFVAIAAIIMLFAAGGIGAAINDALAGLFVAATAWGLAEFFTRKRHMAFPTIILLIAFICGIFYGFQSLITLDYEFFSYTLISAFTAFAAWLHWKRFQVPITIAAGALALALMAISFIGGISAAYFTDNIILTSTLLSGLAIFAFAMWWDISDKARETRRSDIAFWLHLLAAPMIAHPLFYFIGATGGEEITGLQAFSVLAAYIAMGIIAIVIDRRAMLVSALAYVLIALAILFNQFGVIELNVALTAFIIGSALLSLSAFWTPLRKKLVSNMPDIIKANVPAT